MRQLGFPGVTQRVWRAGWSEREQRAGSGGTAAFWMIRPLAACLHSRIFRKRDQMTPGGRLLDDGLLEGSPDYMACRKELHLWSGDE